MNTSSQAAWSWNHASLYRVLTIMVALAMGLYHIWVILFGSSEALLFRGTHVLFAVTLTLLLYTTFSRKQDEAPGILDYAVLAISIAPVIYVLWNQQYIDERTPFGIDPMLPWDIIMSIIMVVVVLEATRRVIGLALPLTAIVFLVYGFWLFRNEPTRVLEQLYMGTEGIFGIPISVSATYVLIFVLFGAFMERTGTGQLFMDFAMALTGHTAGGPGKVAVVSSSLFGTISGSAVANVMVDGPISIPLMKRSGFPAHFAAGVEATASTGGQIMPPIMGAAAFLLAQNLQVSYSQVIIWALIPAILYYVACFCAVHFEAKRNGIHGVPRSELPQFKIVMAERGHLFLPIIIILVVMYSGYSAPLAALAGTAACFPVAALRKSTRVNCTLQNLIEAFYDGAKNALGVALACACAGIVIGVVTQTNLGIIFTQYVTHISQNTLLLALVLTMVAAIVLGMGMPTTPAYIILTALLIPAIIKLGVDEPAAHMFAFYFAVLSAITPPVALAVFAAAGIAKADLWKSGMAAVKVGAAGFIVPFMFVYEPALLMIHDSWGWILWRFVLALVGIAMLSGGLHGYFVDRASTWQRIVLVAAGFALVAPNLWADLFGIGAATFIIVIQWLQRKRVAATARP
ncbi:MAG: TRAP transporter permease [Rhizobiales bacterium]|nr:TRAP transporter permease [Hyphomicrobiales bacterium]